MCLTTLVLGSWVPREVRALDLVGIGVAAGEVRAALDEMADALNAAPLEVQTAIGADLHLMSQAVARALARLENGAVPIVDPTLVYDLNLLADIAQTATSELQTAATANGAALAPDRIERIDALTDAAAGRLVEVNLVIEGWTERARNAVVELTEADGKLVVRSIDRLVYNGVRYASIGLLLVGLLVVGLQLLRMSEDRVDSFALLRETPVLSVLAVTALTLFFVGCFTFSLYPGSLAALSAEIRQQPQEHPCERLAEQRARLIAAQQVQHDGLIEATKQRMAPAAQDCLGLPSDIATAEAVDLLADKTAVTRREPRRPSRAEVAATAPEPQEQASDADDTTVPALPAAADLADTAEVGALAELVTQLRDAEDALSERLDDAVAEELEEAGDPAAPGPEPAAGPAPPEEPAKPASTDEAAGPAADPAPTEEVATPAISPATPDEPATPAAGAAAAADVSEPQPALADAAPASSEVPNGSDSELYVTTTAVNYRDGPSLGARRLGTFVPGATLAVIGENDGWSEVRLGDGREVFVASEFLELAP